ncbi:heparinase II/III family protein [Paenibacillus cymbidii]|uniref:heparinase II/III family protein n=1 Tax=Paenibacillus cymbidii TaxID=1639034 RepID=UPI00108002DC|nr:heparinase II/III family protein [Paenibacillus cymbidii]
MTVSGAADNANAAFMGLIDLTSAGLEEVNMLARRKQWKEAMAAYVAILGRRLKQTRLTPLPDNPRYREDAELLLDNRISLLNSPLVAIGDPIDWLLAPGGDKQWQSHLGYMYFPNCLVQAYQATGETRYRDKWLAIMRNTSDLAVKAPAAGDTSALEDLAADAQILHDGTMEGGGSGQSAPGAKAIFAAAIGKANDVPNAPSYAVTQLDADQAEAELNAAIVAFQAAIHP